MCRGRYTVPLHTTWGESETRTLKPSRVRQSSHSRRSLFQAWGDSATNTLLLILVYAHLLISVSKLSIRRYQCGRSISPRKLCSVVLLIDAETQPRHCKHQISCRVHFLLRSDDHAALLRRRLHGPWQHDVQRPLDLPHDLRVRDRPPSLVIPDHL